MSGVTEQAALLASTLQRLSALERAVGTPNPIGSLSDVDAPSPGDGDALFYNLGTGMWEPVPAATQAELDAAVANLEALVTGFYLPLTGGTITGNLEVQGANGIATYGIRSRNGQQLILAGGESWGQAYGNVTGEIIYAVAEGGLQVIGTIDNWSSGWAGRREIDINPRGNGGAGLIQFPNEVGRKINLWGTNYGIGISSNTVDLDTGRYIQMNSDIGDSRRMAFDIEGKTFTIFSQPIGAPATEYYQRMGAVDATWARFATNASKFHFDKTVTLGSNNIESYDGALWLSESGTLKLALDDSWSSFFRMNSNYADGDFRNGFSVRSQNASSGAQGEMASLVLWTEYGTDAHVNFLLHRPAGDKLYLRNAENTAWINGRANAWEVASSGLHKARIRTGREVGGLLDYALPGNRKLAFRQVRKLRPVLFDDEVQHQEKKFHEDGSVDRWNHHCDDEDCCGTSERPCDLIGRHVDRVGLIAEEVEEVFPKAVSRDANGDAPGIDYAVITNELINEFQHLLEDRDEARSREARNTMMIRRLQRENQQLSDRLAAIEAQLAS